MYTEDLAALRARRCPDARLSALPRPRIVSRVGLGRHSRIEENAGDPLDGLVNLFDIGIVLAVAFLIAGLSLTVDPTSGAGRAARRAPRRASAWFPKSPTGSGPKAAASRSGPPTASPTAG